MDSRLETTRAETDGWHRSAAGEGATGKKTILFVEDEIFVRNVTTEVLRAAGYQVLTARNAAEALILYDRAHGEVDLLLTDLILPGESGRVLALGLEARNPRLKVLLVTGYAEHIQMCEYGHACLPKPFSSTLLLGKVRMALEEPAAANSRARLACANG